MGLEVQVLFSQIGLDIDDHRSARILFELFDKDGDSRVNIDEFVHGMAVYRDGARSVEMCHHFKRLNHKIDKAMRIAKATHDLFAQSISSSNRAGEGVEAEEFPPLCERPSSA